MSKLKMINSYKKCLYKTAMVYIENEDFEGIERLLIQYQYNTSAYFLFLYKLYEACNSIDHWEKLYDIRQRIQPVNKNVLWEYLLSKEDSKLFKLSNNIKLPFE